MKAEDVGGGPSKSTSGADGSKSQTFLKVGSNYYILASSLTSRRETRVLADGRSFAVFEVGGDLAQSPLEALGFFYRDTRFLSAFELSIAGMPPYFLNSYLSDDNAELRVNLTNPDLVGQDGRIDLPRDSIQIERSWVLLNAALYHRLVISNYTRAPAKMPFALTFGVDFEDLFEVRGVKRDRRGEYLDPQVSTDGQSKVHFCYRGLDHVDRVTEIYFDPKPDVLTAKSASFALELAAEQSIKFEVRVNCGVAPERGTVDITGPANFQGALAIRNDEITTARSAWAKLSASDARLEILLKRSTADLTTIIAQSDHGSFMMAGIPWFATLFGRDSIITSLSLLPFNPEITGHTLRALAGFQGSEVNQARDEQPGKIVHEMRSGEMAATGEIPFGRYYGTIDATPLFLWLLGRHAQVTGDLRLATELWPNVERALEWIERFGDRDHDGYIEYERETPSGLVNQGWKDSFDSISHANGDLAEAPIALAEVQGYVYAAYTTIADIAGRLGHSELADRLAQKAVSLQQQFIKDFWLEQEQTVAIALDGAKKPCRIMSSNAAHCLATGLVQGPHAKLLANRLMRDDMFSGWGIRTLSNQERRYNPMSYHNGSVWPHDNALAAVGLALGGNRSGVIRVLDGLLEAAVHFRAGSLPELFCGFQREQRLGPVPYPVACHPQAWSAASLFLILQAMLGMRIRGFERKITIDNPIMPPWLEWLKIEDLRVGDCSVSLRFLRIGEAGTVEVLEKHGPVTIEETK